MYAHQTIFPLKSVTKQQLLRTNTEAQQSIYMAFSNKCGQNKEYAEEVNIYKDSFSLTIYYLNPNAENLDHRDFTVSSTRNINLLLKRNGKE